MAQATCQEENGEMPGVVQHEATEAASKETLLVPPPCATPEDSAGVASPDSGRGTTCSQSDGGQSEPEPSNQQQQKQQQKQQQQQQTSLESDVVTPMMAPMMVEPPIMPMGRPIDYQWMNGHQHHHMAAARVIEPVAINPETGFATVLVDASAMAGYPHHLPAGGAPWPHHHHHHHAVPGYHHHHHHHHVMQQPPGAHFPSAQAPPPPPAHFLHPHAFHEAAMTGEYAAYLASPAYDPSLLAAPAYDPSAVYDLASLHLNAASNGHLPAYVKPTQRRPNRGSSVSPKRPSHRSSSQQPPVSANLTPATSTAAASSCGRRTSSTLGSTGRYTPSPSARSRGSSPGQHSTSSTGATGPANATPSDQHVVHLHVNPGETISFQMEGQVQVIQGPAMVRMVSTGSPPVPLPVQVPPGHVLHQIVDERGTLRHVILSPAPAAANQQTPGPAFGPAGAPTGPVGALPLATPTHPPPPPPHYAPPPATSGSSTSSPPHYFVSNGTGAGNIGAYHHHHHHQQQQQPRPPPTSSPSSYHPGLAHRPVGGAGGSAPQQQSTHAAYNMSSAHSSSGKGPSPPSPSSSPNFASERAQRQAAKLRKKLESRSSKGSQPASLSSNDTPPSSPKKDNNNIRKLKDRNQNGAVEASNEEHVDGKDGKDAKDVKETLASRITDLKAPQVSDIESRSANVSWEPVETVISEPSEPGDSDVPDISYEATVGLKRANQDRPSTYRGKECHFKFADLEPGSDYWVRLSALADEIKVKEAPVVEFRTEACPPDAPMAPKLQNRTRNTLVMRWTPPGDNGSPISAYVLECDDGTGSEQFAEVYRGRGKQFTIAKLQSSTCYAIRLAACNDVGTSGWSDVCRVTTMGAPPPPPSPPTLVSASAKQMSLSWAAVSPDMLYTLQMADPLTGHGFLNAYHGPDNEHACTGLMRSTTYRFRLQAQNDDGTSRWSEEASYSTTPDRPAAPARPSVKGRIQSHSLRVRWDPPSDSGGAPLQQYVLELDSGSGFGHLWTGAECEFSCERLTPGTTYRLRVACSNGHELSDYSEPLIVTTEPVCPAAPAAPVVSGKAKSTSLHLKWERPSYDGGSMVTQYEVNMIGPDGGERVVFSGFETECLVASLLPGRTYSFQVRASNRIGFGPWSDPLETKSGPGAPEAPGSPQVAHRSSHSLALAWTEPCSNGAPISEYRLEMAHHPRQQIAKSPSSASLSTADSIGETSGKTTPVTDEPVDADQLSFALCHSGPTKQFEVKGLQPWSTYHFRVQAANAVGHSAYSPVASFSTLASSPAAVSGLRLVSSTTTILSLSWNAPPSNGSPITHYNIEVSDRGVVSTSDPATTHDLEHLTPDTTYRIRVQAANAIGVGSFSGAAKFSTRPLPPEAPRLECAQFGHNSLKLRWGDSKKPDFLSYTLEMREEGSDRFYVVHEGPGQSCRVSKLSESTVYTFRICARNDVGEGPYSEQVAFQTTRAPPPALKKLDVLELTETSCRLVWSATRPSAPGGNNVVYHVEVTRTKDHHQIMSERCAESDASLDNLDPQTEYSIRVCPIRVCEDGDIAGTAFPTKTFTTLAIPVKSAVNSKAAPSLLSSFKVAGKVAAVPSIFNRLWTVENMPLLCTGFLLIICVMFTIVISSPHFRSSAP